MPYPVSDAFIQMLMASDQTRIATAEIWNKNTPLVQLGTWTDGSVNIDATAPVRRTCTATIESLGLEFDDLVPTSAKSLLHPASGNELRLFRGFKYPGPTFMNAGALKGQTVLQELCPLGVFRMTKPVVTDTGDNITIAVTGNDRSSLVSRRTWTDVFPINPGTDLRLAIFNLLQNRVGDLDLTYNFVSTPGITVPTTTFGTSLANSNDPWADAISLAVAGPLELFFDETGNPVLQPAPIADIDNAAFPFAYQEGDNCTFNETERSLDETVTYNGVIVVGVGSGGAPVTAEIWDTDPASPLWIGGPWGKQPYIYQTTLVPSIGQSGPAAQAQVASMAEYIYRQVHTLLDIPEFQAVPNPALLESDTLDLVRKRIGLNGPYVAGQISMPADISTTMQVTARAPVVKIPTQ